MDWNRFNRSNCNYYPIGIVFFQRFGTQKVGSIFGPVMAIWFVMLFVMGFPKSFTSISYQKFKSLLWIQTSGSIPGRALILGAVFLATTGAEALYSDLGHCGRQNIRITWGFVKICLVANYLGQAAWLIHHGDTFLNQRNPFFEMMPHWFLLPGIIIATFATIIASQALISGSYTLISEAMNLNFWPRVAVRQPTETKGQIYIPSVNNLLWIGCIMMILYFKSSTHMKLLTGSP